VGRRRGGRFSIGCGELPVFPERIGLESDHRWGGRKTGVRGGHGDERGLIVEGDSKWVFVKWNEWVLAWVMYLCSPLMEAQSGRSYERISRRWK